MIYLYTWFPGLSHCHNLMFNFVFNCTNTVVCQFRLNVMFDFLALIDNIIFRQKLHVLPLASYNRISHFNCHSWVLLPKVSCQSMTFYGHGKTACLWRYTHISFKAKGLPCYFGFHNEPLVINPWTNHRHIWFINSTSHNKNHQYIVFEKYFPLPA